MGFFHKRHSPSHTDVHTSFFSTWAACVTIAHASGTSHRSSRGIISPTFQLVDNPLYFLSHIHPIYTSVFDLIHLAFQSSCMLLDQSVSICELITQNIYNHNTDGDEITCAPLLVKQSWGEGQAVRPHKNEYVCIYNITNIIL